ncbi:MAG: HAD-IIA family hydrolase [Breznakia sp.]
MKTYLIDLDGTLFRGHTIIDGAIEFLENIKKHHHNYIFLTNNSSRTHQQNVQHMTSLGFENITADSFFTSSMAAAKHIAKISDKRNAYMIGKDGLQEALLEEGFQLVDKDVDFVFVGLNKEGSYPYYSKALKHLQQGAKLVGTNNDRLLATDTGFSLGNGSIVAMFEYASNQKSVQIGKPYKVMLDECLDFIQCRKDEVVLVGDNLDTEIKLGLDYDVETIFVETGVHSFDDLKKLDKQPTQCVKTLHDVIF